MTQWRVAGAVMFDEQEVEMTGVMTGAMTGLAGLTETGMMSRAMMRETLGGAGDGASRSRVTPEQARSRALTPRTMRAIVREEYCDVDGLALREVPRPVAGPGEVLVRVMAAGMDRGVWHIMTGLPKLMRIMGFGFSRPSSPLIGHDVAGIVEAVGEGVTRFAPGDAVFGISAGAFAELAVARQDQLAHKPQHLSFAQAAAITTSALAAMLAVDAGGVQAGQRVLITGAAGGVGSFAVQMVAARGAVVTGVDSADKEALARDLGAADFIDFRAEDFTALAGDRAPYDVVIDIAGNTPVSRIRRALTPTGTLVIIGGEGGGALLGGVERQVGAMLLSMFTTHTLKAIFSEPDADNMQALATLLSEGAFAPVIDRAFPLDEVQDAMRRMLRDEARGKIVITI